jgi:single-stranded DNA-binding protein
MSTPKVRPLVINQVLLTGTVLGDPETRRAGEHRHPIVTFEAETVQYVGKDERPETLRWRGKCFGVTATKLQTELRKGLKIFVRGRFSSYKRPIKGPMNDAQIRAWGITEVIVQELATEPPVNVVFRADISEQPAEEKQQELEEDLNQ